MAISTPDLSTLDATQVSAIQAELAARLQAAYPTLDFRRGVFYDRLLYLSAILTSAIRTEITQLQDSMSLSALAANPTLADDATVAALLSNYFVTPDAGAAASGPVTFIVSTLAPLTIASGATFEVGSIQVSAPNATSVRTSQASVTSANDRVLQPLPNGTYAFTITLQAVAAGSAGLLSVGTAVIPDQAPTNFVSAYVESDWTGGVDAQDPVALANQLQTGLAAKAWSNRQTILAMIVAQAQFANLAGLSIIGSGDGELVRSRHGLFPVSLPGYCDVYVRSSASLNQAVLTKTATLVQVTATGGIWQFGIGVNDAPGFLFVSQILPYGTPPQSTGFAVTSDVRGYDLDGFAWVPDIESAVEAVYSPFQTGVFQFLDTSTPTIGLTVGTSTGKYTVTLATSNLVGPLQAFLSGRSVRPPGGDILVKGAIPAVVRVSVTLWLPAGAATPDTTAMAAAMATAANAVGFAGQLFASTLGEAAASLLPAGAAFGQWDIFAVIRTPAGSPLYLHDGVVLSIPTDFDAMISSRTVAFFLDSDDVALNVVTMPTLQF